MMGALYIHIIYIFPQITSSFNLIDYGVNVMFFLGNTEIVCALLHLTKLKISLSLCYTNADMLCHLTSPL